MKSFTYTFLALLLSNSSFAVEIPNQFEDGQVTSASQMNENFQALKVEIESLKSQFSNQTKDKIKFIGFSESSMHGGVGLFAMQSACSSLDEESHVCSDSEIIRSTYNYNANNLDGFAWIISEKRYADGVAYSTMQSEATSSYDGYKKLIQCQGLRSSANDHRGQAIDSNGRFYSASCDSEMKIACCK